MIGGEYRDVAPLRGPNYVATFPSTVTDEMVKKRTADPADQSELLSPSGSDVRTTVGSDASSGRKRRDISDLSMRKPARVSDARVRLPVSGSVLLRPLEASIVDTRTFQRLRKIRQLGGTYLVYPGANHSRFEHCLGALAMAERICDAVNAGEELISKEQREVIRLAAILHDLGHLPFGHTLEDEVRLFGKHDSPRRVESLLGTGEILDVVRQANREALLTAARAVLEKGAADRLPAKEAFKADIVANTICADLLDYLRRDFYHLGLSYNFDDRIFDYMTLADDEQGRRRFAIKLYKSDKFRHDATTQILEILNLRYTLAECALFHHAKDAHSAMLSRALLESEFLLSLAEVGRTPEGIAALRAEYADEPGSQVPLYFGNGSEIDPGVLLDLGDDELVTVLRRDGNPVASSLGRMIESRQFYKMRLAVPYDEKNVGVQRRLIAELHQTPSGRFAMERQIEDELGLARGSVLLYCPSAEMNAKLAEVHVVDDSGVAVPLSKLERMNGGRLTGGFLDAQIERFQRLWRMYVFAHPAVSEKESLRIKEYFQAIYQLNATDLPTTERDRSMDRGLKSLAIDILGERYPDLPQRDFSRLREEVALVGQRGGAKDRVLRSMIDALDVALSQGKK